MLEITLRSENALELLRSLAGEPDLLVGAGTVIRPEQVDQALAAGARFVVTPGVSSAVLVRCPELGVPVIPGVATATEVIAALDHGCPGAQALPGRGKRRHSDAESARRPVSRGALRADRRGECGEPCELPPPAGGEGGRRELDGGPGAPKATSRQSRA